MTFDEMLEQALEMLQRRGRVSYRALKAQFQVDDDLLDVLKEEIIEVHQLGKDQDGRMLVWTDYNRGPSAPLTASCEPTDQIETHETPASQAATHPSDIPTPEAERRQLTVMFCDLVDSTALSGQLDPEDLRDVIRAYQTACTEVIQRFDGHVAQLLGDGLLVYFGYPQAHEDDAQRAIHAGLGMSDAIGTLNQRLEREQGVRLAVRIGVHTGLVVIGEMGGEGRQEQLALGETPNIAARLQGLAQPNTMVVSSDAYRLIQGDFDCHALGEHELRGVSQPIVVYCVLQASDAQGLLEVVSTRDLTPLVGRRSERQLLIDRWSQVKSGEGQVVVLTAEPGLGKSRMVQALREHLVGDIYTRLECRSSPYYQNTALYPVVDLIQRTLGWEHNDPPDKKLSKLEQSLSQYRLPVEETVPLIAGLLSLSLAEDKYPPLNMTSQQQRQKALATIVAMLMELTEREPVLFILEDLHWTDPSTLDLLDLLVDQTPRASICTLLTCRPEFQAPWTNRSYFTQITLNRLSREGIEQMAIGVTGGKSLPEEVLQQLVEKTDGVPLYVEEMTKSILESGLLKETADQYQLTGAISSLSIPATLQDSLMARLDRLVTAKAVAQYASVIGRQFSYELLQAVSELDEATLQRELGRLVEAELVYQQGLPPQATYLFKHALVQDIAYESLLRRTRLGYHGRVGKVLQDRFPEMVETQPELIAHHYSEAALDAEAVQYWQSAGDRAFKRSAHPEAVGHFTHALDRLPELADSTERLQREFDITVQLAPTLVATKGPMSPEVESIYTRLRQLCTEIQDLPQLAPTLLGLIRFYATRGESLTSREIGEELFNLTCDQPDSPQHALALIALGNNARTRGDLPQALAHFINGRQIYNAQSSATPHVASGHDSNVSCRLYGALTLWTLGYLDQAREWYDEAIELSISLSHPYTTAFSLMTSAVVQHNLREDISQQQEHIETAITLMTEYGFTLYLSFTKVLEGLMQVVHGQHEIGLAQMRESLSAIRTTGTAYFVPHLLALLAKAYGQAQQYEKGLEALDEGLALIEKTGERSDEAELHRLRGELLLKTVHTRKDTGVTAEDCFQKALSVARQQQAKSWELRAATSLARLWQSQDKGQDAYELLAPVYGWFTEGFDTADLIDAKTLLDELAEVRS